MRVSFFVAAMVMLSACQSLPPAPQVSAVTGEISMGRATVGPLAPGPGRFELSGWGGPDLPVWTYVPIDMAVKDAPIVIVMHGTRRDADRYRDEWTALAQLNGFVVVAPEFSDRDYPTAAGYNLGNVFREEGIDPQPETEWAFSAIEPLFDIVVDILDSSQTDYTIYGHSAGSQFVHRFLLYKPETRARRYIAANAGWYTLADFDETYPYGLAGSGLDAAAMSAAFEKDVIILLGDLDNDPNHPSLRRAPEAMRQGPHRFARGVHFHNRAKAAAEALGVAFNWQVAVVRNARHSNAQMAIGAIDFIE